MAPSCGLSFIECIHVKARGLNLEGGGDLLTPCLGALVIVYAFMKCHAVLLDYIRCCPPSEGPAGESPASEGPAGAGTCAGEGPPGEGPAGAGACAGEGRTKRPGLGRTLPAGAGACAGEGRTKRPPDGGDGRAAAGGGGDA